MALSINYSRQRVPMVDGSTLEDRTRPALEDSGSIATRLRFYQWPSWSPGADRTPSHQALPTQARLGRR